MKHKTLLLCSSMLLLTACQKPLLTEQQTNSKVNAKKTNHLMHYSEDTKGRAEFPRSRPATGKKVFVFDPKISAWAVYDASGHRVKTGRASGGRGYCPDVGRACKTVRGKFSIYSKKGADCKSSKFPLGKGGAPMPHCMHFYKGYAIHGSYDVPNGNASHGCIRVLPSAAQWLNTEFLNHGSTVIIKPY